VGPRAGLDAVEGRKISAPTGNRTPDPLQIVLTREIYFRLEVLRAVTLKTTDSRDVTTRGPAALHRTTPWSYVLEGNRNVVFLDVILSPSSGGTYSVEPRASPYLRTPVHTPDRVYKPIAAHININVKNSTRRSPCTRTMDNVLMYHRHKLLALIYKIMLFFTSESRYSIFVVFRGGSRFYTSGRSRTGSLQIGIPFPRISGPVKSTLSVVNNFFFFSENGTVWLRKCPLVHLTERNIVAILRQRSFRLWHFSVW
jgi:hypothetical protein